MTGHEYDVPLPPNSIQYEGLSPNVSSLHAVVDNLQRQILGNVGGGGGGPGTGNTEGIVVYGNVGAVLSPPTETTHIWNSPLTINRAVSLLNVAAVEGDFYRLVRSLNATGAFSINVTGTGLAVDLAVPGDWVEVQWSGTAWWLVEKGNLGGFASGAGLITASGNLTTQTPTIPLPSGQFRIIITVDARGDPALTTTQSSTCQQDILMGYNPVGTAVIQGVANAFKTVLGDPAVITYTASGDNLLVTIAGAVYAHALSSARIEFQIV